MRKKILLAAGCFLITIIAGAQTSAISFDGSNDYVEVADHNAIDLASNFTLEAWIYPVGTGSDPVQGGIIINKENSYEIARFADGTIQFALSANGVGNDWTWVNTNLTAPLNQWSHIALVKNGTAVTVYRNAVAPYSNNAQPATLAANTQNLRLGTRSNAGQYFNGYIDEVRIWNTARTQGEVKTYLFDKNLSASASGLVAYYKMNTGAGTNLINTSTNTTGIDGTLVNGPVWVASPVQFAVNALSFDGTNDVVPIADDNTLDITTAITLEGWIYATKNGGVQNVISKSSNSSNNGYIFPRTDDGWANAVFYLHVAGGFRTLSAAYPSLNAWHHLAATYDGATMNLYIDGVLAASRAQTGTISANGNQLTFGNQTGFDEYFGGYGDEFRIWNVARTQTQIQNNMNSELDPASQTGLVSYFTFNQGIASGDNTGLIPLPDQKGTNNGTLSNFALTGSSSNFVAQNNSVTVLPLQWLSFTAQKQDEKITLNWSTAGEQNTKDFLIQHSVNGIDWNTIAIMPAANNSTVTKNYSYVHASPVTGSNFYRLQQRDLDYRSSYSIVRSINYSATEMVFSVMNNPVVNGMLQVQINTAAVISLFDADGRLVYQKGLSAGKQSIDVRRYRPGMYLMKADNQVVKVVLQ
jgi:hypothetical protein